MVVGFVDFFGGSEKEAKEVPKHLVIQEVVREPKMKFFKVPSLGSFVAVRLSYKSYLSVEALDKAIIDQEGPFKTRQAEQEEAKKQWEEDQEIEKAEKEKEG